MKQRATQDRLGSHFVSSVFGFLLVYSLQEAYLANFTTNEILSATPLVFGAISGIVIVSINIGVFYSLSSRVSKNVALVILAILFLITIILATMLRLIVLPDILYAVTLAIGASSISIVSYLVLENRSNRNS